ncbi:acyltransferase family protein [Acidaminobacter sp. JC074]|uniref:acyltransferase family protein n=1 Tax=Acidaminobacter sp. JC074 TaxID=2530199 RepID=UPI001F1069AB|nr:acyltransferase family protein [Acidaminobacter sp. JC074]
MTKRVFYLDNLKIILTMQVILFHVAIVFGGAGEFIISAPTQASESLQVILTGFLAYSQSYFMGLFFTISAFFSYKSIKKKGKQSFIKGKVKRLFIPVLLYYFIVSPLIFIIKDLAYYGLKISEVTIRFNMGAIWFMLVLFIFDVLFAKLIYRESAFERGFPKSRYLLFLVALVTVITFVVRVFYPVGYFLPIVGFQPAHIPQYIFAYSLGVLFSKHDWLTHLKSKKYEYLTLLLIPLLLAMAYVIRLMVYEFNDITYAFGGFSIYQLLYSFFDQVMYLVMTLSLLSIFQKYLNKTSPVLKSLSSNAFGAYMVHSFVIVMIVIVLKYFSLSHMLGFLVTSILAISLSFALGRYIK